jgi:hypothetical protein
MTVKTKKKAQNIAQTVNLSLQAIMMLWFRVVKLAFAVNVDKKTAS